MVSRSRMKRIWQFVRPSRGRLLLVFAMIVLSTASGLAMPVLLEQTIDRALRPPYDRDLLVTISVIVVVAGVVRFFTGYWQQVQMTHVTTRVLFRMRQTFYRHLQRMSLAFFTRTRIGDILTRLGRDIAEIQGAATGALLGFAASVLTIVGTVSLLVWYSPELFVLSLIVVPFVALIARAFRRIVMDRTREVRETNERISSFLVETVSGMKTVRAHGRERGEARRFVQLQRTLIDRVMRMVVASALGGGLPQIVIMIGSTAVFLYGGLKVIDGELELGDLVAFSILQARVYGPVQGLVRLYLQLQQATVSVDRIFEYLDMPASAADAPDAVALDSVAGRVELRGVTFAYEPGRPVLEDVTLDIAPGERCAVIGPSGSGKSTLLDLVFRLQRPGSGVVAVDGADIAGVVLSSLNRHLGFVPQDPVIFHDTLAANVRYGRPDATDEDVAEACRVCALDDVIARLPDGVATVVGERGAALSGGERQRIALARAWILRPRVLVLDEPMSHLDRDADVAVSSAIRSTMEGRTCIVAAHRLPPELDIERVIVLEAGRIVSDGSPERLARECEVYRRLHAPRGSA